MHFTENMFEQAVIELFQNMGYAYVYGPAIDRDYHSPLYEDVLLPSLLKINPTLPPDALTEAIYKLKTFESGTLLQKT